ncbi:MAG TPA: MarC family NAAT transporter [Saprospiraceae bacterium]|nr:MarC family NAAT transporter [Saprospiraceae bacterium]
MIELFIAILASLFSVVNPIGAVPVFLSLTPDYTAEERSRTSLHTSLYFVLILLSFFFGGAYILSFFGISVNAMRIAGGLVILSSGYSLLGGKFEVRRGMDKKVRQEAMEKEDISFSPMAMPMLSGPGSISLLISLYSEYQDWSSRGVIALVILATGALVYLTLRTSPFLYKLMGEAGLKAISRIMGFIVMAIGIQYIIGGIVQLVKTLA